MRLFFTFAAAPEYTAHQVTGSPKSQDSAASPAMGKLRPGRPFNPARGAWQTLAVRM
ncbi:unnamed protein product [Staurois parvus]|uniref:Uncharacterized protein n=1 Tax=Staurois parvus TaxID=386267 RepID=A0ABN9G8X3_9NEOB|nr:unnamed protein product [Staurois parvus]